MCHFSPLLHASFSPSWLRTRNISQFRAKGYPSARCFFPPLQAEMKTAMRTTVVAVVLALCVGLAAAQFGRPFGGGGGGGSGGGSGSGQQCNTGCCNLGNQVFHGACSSFSNYFRGDADTAINENDSAFQQRVNGAPTPSDSCCTSARSFVQYGCSCNSELQQAASQQGFTNNQVRVISRAVQDSICSNSAHGGSISTGGC